VASLRNHGAKVKYFHDEVAYNSRLDEIQAAVLRLKLRHLDVWNEKRRMLARGYSAALKGLPITLPTEIAGRHHVFHLYSIQSDRRDELKSYLQEHGIATGLHYPIPLHLLPALKFMGHRENDFPNGERLARQTLSLPLYAFMTMDEVSYVADTVRAFFQNRA
jgi:dTDP-4-amino-4,6-dideoxygalactose transaminase